MAASKKLFFLGNCQTSRFAQFYGVFTPPKEKGLRDYLSITPHYGKYDESTSLRNLETADIVVSQLVESDYIFNRENILAIRNGKPTIFVPYVYLTGFRRIERIASKGVNRIDGADIVLDEVKRVGPSKAALNYMRGEVVGQNRQRFEASLDTLRSKEHAGADVKIADFIAENYQGRVPCFSINHPAPYVLFEMYNQIAAMADLHPIDESKVSSYDLGRSTLPQGHCALSPYCVDELNLSYGAETHWFATTNRLVQEVIRNVEAGQV